MTISQELGFAAPPPPIGGLLPDRSREDLARGLLLLRASSMNLMRFQLAMERRDRAVALQTVDEMVAIDGRLRDFLQEMPVPGGSFAGLVGEVERQRASLVREKLTLVAGKAGPAVRQDQPEWAEPVREPAPVREEEYLLEQLFEEPAAAGKPWAYWLIGLLALACIAAALWFSGVGGDLLEKLSTQG